MNFDGRRVLIVEDDVVIAMLLEDMVRELGCTVIGPANTLAQAFVLADANAAMDAAFLDVNMNGAPVFPLADALRSRGVPIIFSTGYGDAGLREADQGVPVLFKPYRSHHLAAALAAVLETQTPVSSSPDACAAGPRSRSP